MMDEAFFVSAKTVLAWLNETFGMHMTKIEDGATGAVFCQIVDAVFGGEVSMSKVRWDAKSTPDYVANFKLAQAVLNRHGVSRHVDVDKVIRAKFQDNLELLQWAKAFYERSGGGTIPYDALARRALGRGANSVPSFALTPGGSVSAGGPPPTSARSARLPPAPVVASVGAASNRPPVAARSAAAPARSASSRPALPSTAPQAATAAVESTRSSPPAVRASQPTSGADADARGRVSMSPREQRTVAAAAAIAAEQEAHIAELRVTCESLERERDYYFGKLRAIELLFQTTLAKSDTAEPVLAVMYREEPEAL